MEPLRPTSAELTGLLKAWSDGDAGALERLTPVVYAELHRIARRNLAGEREAHLLQPSSLVNEAFVRLMGGAPVQWASRAHFFAVSARLMRQILIDFARARDTDKRGHRSPHVDVSSIEHLPGETGMSVDFIDLDAALDQLAGLDQRQAQIVELRYFGGLENNEIASVLGISEPTVVRDWRVARAWLYARLHPEAQRTSQ